MRIYLIMRDADCSAVLVAVFLLPSFPQIPGNLKRLESVGFPVFLVLRSFFISWTRTNPALGSHWFLKRDFADLSILFSYLACLSGRHGSAGVLQVRIPFPYLSQSKCEQDTGVYEPGAFKLDHFQPLKLPVFQKFPSFYSAPHNHFCISQTQLSFRVTLPSNNSGNTTWTGVLSASFWGTSCIIPLSPFWEMATLTPLFWSKLNFYLIFHIFG